MMVDFIELLSQYESETNPKYREVYRHRLMEAVEDFKKKQSLEAANEDLRSEVQYFEDENDRLEELVMDLEREVRVLQEELENAKR